MNIGVIRERNAFDRRVALTPAVVRRLAGAGHTVWVETGAGEGAMFPDADYLRAGARIGYSAAEVLQRAELAAKIARPTPQEIRLCRQGAAVMAFYHMAVADKELLDAIAERSLTTIGSEIIQLDNGRLPVLAAISEIGGQLTIPIAAHLLRSSSGGRGILLGGTPGVPPARVVILGAGAVGSAAARTAQATGARVTAFDVQPSKLRRMMDHVRGVATCLADPEDIAEAVASADIVIGAVLVAGTRTPHVVTRAMVETHETRRRHHRCGYRPGRLRGDQPAHHAGGTHLRLQRRDAFLRSQLHRGPGTLVQRCYRPGHAALRARTGGPRHRCRNRRVSRFAARRLHHSREASVTNDYRSRIVSADEAVAAVQSGQRVYIHNGCAEPIELVQGADPPRAAPAGRGGDAHGHHGDRRLQPAGARRPLPHQLPCSSAATCGAPSRKAAATTPRFS